MQYPIRLFALLLVTIGLSSASYGEHTKISQRMIDELNPNNFKKDFSDYDQKTAVFCGQLSDAAYMIYADYLVLEQQLNKSYGRGRFSIIPIDIQRTHTRAVICATDEFIVVAFRGTEANVIKDLITDVKITRYISDIDADEHIKDLPAGHAGFRKGSLSLINEGDLFDTLQYFIQQRSGGSDPKAIPIYLTGHSMGAAYASIFVQPIAKAFQFGGAYNFAPPLAISCSDAVDITQTYGKVIYDIVNYKDYVARAGKYCQTYMHHIGKFYRISDIGRLSKENEHYVTWLPSEHGIGTLLRYHNLSGYMEAIRTNINTNSAISERLRNGEVLFGKEYIEPKCHD